jgi:hypothetical protein
LTPPNLWGIEKDMAKRQTRRSISVSRSTYERLRAYCETNGISMSQFVEHRVGDFLGRSIRRPAGQEAPMAIEGMGERREGVMAVPSAPVTVAASDRVREPVAERALPARPVAPQPAPAVLASAPPPQPQQQTRTAIVPRPAQPAPPPAKLTPDQIFTF